MIATFNSHWAKCAGWLRPAKIGLGKLNANWLSWWGIGLESAEATVFSASLLPTTPCGLAIGDTAGWQPALQGKTTTKRRPPAENGGTASDAGSTKFTTKFATKLGVFSRNAVVLVVVALSASPKAYCATNETPFARAERLCREAKELWEAEPKNSELAWHYARACFDAGEFAPSDPVRAEFATKGIDAARATLRLDPNLAAGHYYLGMNLGQLARTKKLGALKLVDEMESSFYSVIKSNAGFDFAGAHRCLGLLYRDAPGWPISVGSRSKARQHLSKAVELSPEYPDNWLCLIEAYIGWNDKERARTQLTAAGDHLQAARKRFTGVQWQTSWEDWDKRIEAAGSKLHAEKLGSPKSK